jgi:hypothetical protein
MLRAKGFPVSFAVKLNVAAYSSRWVGAMVTTSIAQTGESKSGMCTHKETGIRCVVGIYEKVFGLDDDTGL